MQMFLIATTARRALGTIWLAGPIFEKELRVSSRRRRNFVLRVIYVLAVAAFVYGAWSATSQGSATGGGYQISRMSEAGKQIVMTMTWLQFIVAQFLAAVMLSTAISEEIRQRTLAALLSTPITSLQIVLGKLFSKLLQILLLLAISLPVFAVVRVLGGVPWGFVLAATCVTMAASIFAGSVSLLLSIYTQKPSTVIARVLMVTAVLYLLIPLLALLPFLAGPLGGSSGGWIMGAAVYANPFSIMGFLTREMLSPGGTGRGLWLLIVHIPVMLGLSAIVLAIAARGVRRAALRQVMGQTDGAARSRRRKGGRVALAGAPALSDGPIRRVTGSPVFWKEIHHTSGNRSRWKSRLSGGIAVTLVLVGYGICIWGEIIEEAGTQVAFCIPFMLFAMVASMTTCAMGIPAEKESRTWPLLLTTTLSDGEIAYGKMAGAMRRCLPAWWILFGHIGLFTLAGVIHPVALVHMLLLASGVLVFLAGLGTYVGSRLRGTNSAAAVCFVAALGFWLVLPFLLTMVIAAFGAPGWGLVMLNPALQTGVVVHGAAGSQLEYPWPDGSTGDLRQTTARIAATMLVHVLLGLLLAWAATRNFRRKVFQE
jgi:ABC-type transport system involved in multi-copper enzyme maturation permease subunit